MTRIHIASSLSLDPDYVGAGTFALLAKKGAGKSYTARVMAEEFWNVKVPFVLLDPMGTSWGLRSSADGEGEGIPVAIFGGERGDAPLERGSGGLMADLVVDEGLSMVLDLSTLGTRAAERQFSLDFLERLYRRNRELVHVFMDEADLFAPQKPQAGDRQLLGATENIVRRGRNRGIGITLMTQRPAVLNKDVLTQVDGLVSMRIVGLTDRQAIDKWVEGHGDDPELADTVKSTLASLENGECWWWIPELGILKRVQVRESRTFDSSPSQTRSGRAREPKGFADVDMGAIESKISDTIERAKQDDPKELRKQIAELRQELAQQPEAEPETVEVPVIPDLADALDSLRSACGLAHDVERIVGVGMGQIDNALNDVKKRAGKRVETAQSRGSRRMGGAITPRSDTAASSRPAQRDLPQNSDVRLRKGARRMFDSLARMHPEPLDRTRLAMLSDMKMSGTFNTYLGDLRRSGFVATDRGEISLTSDGVEQLGDAVNDVKPTAQDLLEMWMPKFRAGARRMLSVLVEAYPQGLDRSAIARASDMDTSGTFNTYLGDLRRAHVVRREGHFYFAAEEIVVGV